MKYYTTCRFCKKANFETPKLMMVKYGVRHWCHVGCGIERFGALEFLANKLSPYQIASLPFLELKAHPGALAIAQRIHREYLQEKALRGAIA